MENGQNAVPILDHPQTVLPDAASPQRAGRGALDDLVRRLVDEARRQQPRAPTGACPGADDETEVLLDVEVDSVRCLLIREHSNPLRATLSPREQEIARMVAKGYTNKTIAAVLDISTWTVCTHLRRTFVKLNVGCRAALVARLFGSETTLDSATPLRSDAG